MEKAPDNKIFSGTELPFPWASSIGDRLTMGDVCWYKPGMLNKIGKEGKTSWDSFSYALYMAHNTEIHIDAVQRANRLMDMESARYKMDWKRWRKLSEKESKIDEPSDWVPRNIIYFDQFVQELFESDDPYGMLNNPTAHRFLTELQGGMQRGKLQNDNFNKLFVQEDPMPTDTDLADMNNEKIIELEHSLGL
jgi:hypothetical protein